MTYEEFFACYPGCTKFDQVLRKIGYRRKEVVAASCCRLEYVRRGRASCDDRPVMIWEDGVHWVFDANGNEHAFDTVLEMFGAMNRAGPV